MACAKRTTSHSTTKNNLGFTINGMTSSWLNLPETWPLNGFQCQFLPGLGDCRDDPLNNWNWKTFGFWFPALNMKKKMCFIYLSGSQATKVVRGDQGSNSFTWLGTKHSRGYTFLPPFFLKTFYLNTKGNVN